MGYQQQQQAPAVNVPAAAFAAEQDVQEYSRAQAQSISPEQVEQFQKMQKFAQRRQTRQQAARTTNIFDLNKLEDFTEEKEYEERNEELTKVAEDVKDLAECFTDAAEQVQTQAPVLEQTEVEMVRVQEQT